MSDFDSGPIFAIKARPLFDNAHCSLRNATNGGPSTVSNQIKRRPDRFFQVVWQSRRCGWV
ncbi:hypothetical protein DLM_0220 [Aquitalea magnusonii]|uniref:Uncharacterized protein n=1 Tax=Aquitalea magnusonii TaxID=332411 RepID=A0A3G9GCG3_9NEIS|nr:hypothetical protein DLM_0220 [Aquitalea magnusonii]